MRRLQRYSQQAAPLADGRSKPVWADLPYHYIIYANGEIVEGREAGFAGDTNTDYDPTGHLLICLDGNFEVETPSPQQLQALTALLHMLRQRYQIPVSAIKGHQHYTETLCPGKNFLPWLQQLPQLLE